MPSPTPVDEVFERYQAELAENKSRDERLQVYANLLVNTWPRHFFPRCNELSVRLRKFNANLANFKSGYGNESSVGSYFEIHGLKPRQSSWETVLILHCELTILETVLVQSLSRKRSVIEEFDNQSFGSHWPVDQTYPETQFESILAKFIDRLLHVR